LIFTNPHSVIGSEISNDFDIWYKIFKGTENTDMYVHNKTQSWIIYIINMCSIARYKYYTQKE